jgi:hypothetical protein
MSKVYLGFCVQLYGTHWLRPRNHLPPPPPIWAHVQYVRGLYWSAKLDDISWQPPAANRILNNGPV